MIYIGIVLVMTMTLVYAETQLTADELECNQETALCTAKGNVRVVTQEGDEQRILTAEQVVAHMVKDSASHTSFDCIQAKGSVCLTAKTGDIHANEAIYYPETQKAEFSGNVKIMQKNNNWLTGDFATADLAKGKYHLQSKTKRQVRGLIHTENKGLA